MGLDLLRSGDGSLGKRGSRARTAGVSPRAFEAFHRRSGCATGACVAHRCRPRRIGSGLWSGYLVPVPERTLANLRSGAARAEGFILVSGCRGEVDHRRCRTIFGGPSAADGAGVPGGLHPPIGPLGIWEVDSGTLAGVVDSRAGGSDSRWGVVGRLQSWIGPSDRLGLGARIHRRRG